ncbi:MAG: hypothetical protein KF886_17040 [Candidatus Hydrogenedentes bacterium]|nr:hypothetical protein [Candidatus Hydrogenedentota bacterium]
MSDFAKRWGDVYNKQVQPLQGKGSPRSAEVITVAKGSAGLLKALVELDKNDPMQKNAGKEREALHKTFEKAAKTYKSESARYGKLIDAAIKATGKGEYPEAFRALKSLKAHLDHTDASVEHHAATTTKDADKAQTAARDRVEKEKAEGRKKGKTDEEINKDTEYAKQLIQFTQFATQSKTVATKAKSAVQAIKADPTPQTYNDAMDKGGRNYTQLMSNLIKLSKESKCPPKVKELLNGLDKYKAGLDAYGGGDRRKIPLTTTRDEVLRYNKEYVEILKATYPYAEKLQAFLKKNKLK